jgi:hypothetical protein
MSMNGRQHHERSDHYNQQVCTGIPVPGRTRSGGSMTTIKQTVMTWTIDDHPDPDSVYEWVRNNWHDLGENDREEAVDSLKAFCNFFQVDLPYYSFGIFPDRGDLISIKASDDLETMRGIRVWKYIVNNFLEQHPDLLAGDCPFTGVVYDEYLLDPLRKYMANMGTSYNLQYYHEVLQDCCDALLKALHNNGDHIYSDEGIREFLLANDYLFTEDGEVWG